MELSWIIKREWAQCHIHKVMWLEKDKKYYRVLPFEYCKRGKIYLYACTWLLVYSCSRRMCETVGTVISFMNGGEGARCLQNGGGVEVCQKCVQWILNVLFSLSVSVSCCCMTNHKFIGHVMQPNPRSDSPSPYIVSWWEASHRFHLCSGEELIQECDSLWESS